MKLFVSLKHNNTLLYYFNLLATSFDRWTIIRPSLQEV